MTPLQTVLVATALSVSALSPTVAADKRTFEAEAGELIGEAGKVSDGAASGSFLIGLSKPGDGVRFAGVPAARKLAIRYASTVAGTISVAVNDQPARKVNVHSSGAVTGSFLHAIVDVAIPDKARLTVSVASGDVGRSRTMADLFTVGARQAQQIVAEVTGLTSGTHTIRIVNRASGPVAVDAVIVR